MFWSQLAVQLLGGAFTTYVAFVSDIGIIHPWQRIFLCIGAVGVFVGLMWERWSVYPGLPIAAVGTVLIGASALNTFLLGFTIVVYQAWYIAAYVRKHRPWWLALLFGGSVATISWTLYRWETATPEPRSLKEIATDPNSHLLILITTSIVCITLAVMWTVGVATLKRNQRMETLQARAELATATERNRIAREMHDIVAHSLTVVIAQADGGRYAAAKDPSKAIEALETISSRGREALAQMRSLLTALHDDAESERSVEVTPGVQEMAGLLADARRNGLQINYDVTGEPQAVDEIRGLTIYRVVQESLTNVLKHAGAVPTHVALNWMLERVTIQVDNAPGQKQLPSGGRGLGGIRDRVQIHGGSAWWGESEEYPGGWKIRVELPLKSSH